jgi:hypothetical protein
MVTAQQTIAKLMIAMFARGRENLSRSESPRLRTHPSVDRILSFVPAAPANAADNSVSHTPQESRMI